MVYLTDSDEKEFVQQSIHLPRASTEYNLSLSNADCVTCTFIKAACLCQELYSILQENICLYDHTHTDNLTLAVLIVFLLGVLRSDLTQLFKFRLDTLQNIMN